MNLFATLYHFPSKDIQKMDVEEMIFWKKQAEITIKSMERNR